MSMSPVILCSRCGSEQKPDARFCSSCGKEQVGGDATLFANTEPGAPSDKASLPLPPLRLLPGTLLSGVYAIEDVLGEGGMGVVYRARDQKRDRTVALKCLHTNLSGDAEVRRRFAREAKVLRAWSHEYGVAVYDFIEHAHLLAIVMEHVEGISLLQHLEKWRGRMPLREIVGIFGAVLDAMDDAHKNGIIHRDLKPENILVEERAQGRLSPKIVDFGIAKIFEGTTYTVTGAFLGTCRYMSPEQVQRPELADHRSDIYSLGVTLYQLCTGRVPFDDGNHFALMMAHISQKPPLPSTFRPQLPKPLEELILDALAKDPKARPQTCGEFKKRLVESVGEEISSSAALSSDPESPLPAVIHDTDGFEMVLVPGGPFQMGPNRRTVHLDAFYLDRTPVTNLQFRTFLQITGYKPTDAGSGRFLAHWPRGFIPNGLENHPVVFISWFDARAYAHWAGKRLPTEAEWEKAARGVDGRKYPWGKTDPTPSRANFGGKHKGTIAVGSCPSGVSPFGVHDLSGNVWEWCDDADDPQFYLNGPAHNPHNTTRLERTFFVMRGGSWMYGAQTLRTYSRTSFEPHYRFADGGFRCARSAR